MAPKDGNCWNTLAVAHYRAGDWKAAFTALDKSMQFHSGGDGVDWFFLAMTHWKLGDRERAGKAYDNAVRWMTTNWSDDEELRAFRAEAAALLGKPDSRQQKGVSPKKNG